MDILTVLCGRCQQPTQVTATVIAENGVQEEICPVCLEELKAHSARQFQAGPSEVK